jgi:hypothetical protein
VRRSPARRSAWLLRNGLNGPGALPLSRVERRTRIRGSGSGSCVRARLRRSSRVHAALARAAPAPSTHFDILLAPIESGPQKMRLSPASDRGSGRALSDLDSITAFPAAAALPPHHADLRPQPQQRERARPRA